MGETIRVCRSNHFDLSANPNSPEESADLHSSIPLFSNPSLLLPIPITMMPPSAAETPANDDDSIDDLHDVAFSKRGCCCFSFPCFRSRQFYQWERIPSSAGENETIDRNLWNKAAKAVRKAREWSELFAGPKWKTFIRRFNRSGRRARNAKFQYDPLSYSLNFDQGQGQNGESGVPPLFRDFSSLYSEIPAQKVQICESTWQPRGGR